MSEQRSVFCTIMKGTTVVVNRYILSTTVSATFEEILLKTSDELNLGPVLDKNTVQIRAEVSANANRFDKSLVNLQSSLLSALQLINVQYVDYTLTSIALPEVNNLDEVEGDSTPPKKLKNALEYVMDARYRKRQVPFKQSKNKHHDLYNDILVYMLDNDGGHMSSSARN